MAASMFGGIAVSSWHVQSEQSSVLRPTGSIRSSWGGVGEGLLHLTHCVLSNGARLLCKDLSLFTSRCPPFPVLHMNSHPRSKTV